MNAPTTDDPNTGAIALDEAMKNAEPQSQIYGVSIRGWLAVGLTATVCAMSLAGRTVDEPLYSLVFLAVGFYFGQKK